MSSDSSYDSASDKEVDGNVQRLTWALKQERAREHERLKRKKIEEYERKKALKREMKRKRLSRAESSGSSRSSTPEENNLTRIRFRIRRSPVMSQKYGDSSILCKAMNVEKYEAQFNFLGSIRWEGTSHSSGDRMKLQKLIRRCCNKS